jgi:bifunctional non-homologous end joining protein LigD
VAFQRRKPAAIGVKAPFPGFIEPALASSVGKVPSGARWIHEIKFDGYRVQIHLANQAVKVFTRRGHDWTDRLKKIADDAWHIKAGSAIVDGEIVVPAADGSTDFAGAHQGAQGWLRQDRPGDVRPALPQRPRHPERTLGCHYFRRYIAP